ncbi:MAG: HAD family hydrolase [Bacteroidales bacterium]|nr:HAD family hydrolase [Bacteroidales bacterium]
MTLTNDNIKTILQGVKVIGFDADDTLWVNETYYREAEEHFAVVMAPYVSEDISLPTLTKTEIKNLGIYGYGAKSMTLSMLETAISLSNNQVKASEIEKIIKIGRALLNKPVTLLDGVKPVLQKLKGEYTIILITKGDLIDQERKLKKSGLDQCFEHIEIVSEKTENQYLKLLDLIHSKPEEFMMVGNSLKSDIIPVLKLGGWGIHIPFHTTWVHEETNENPYQWDRFFKMDNLSELLNVFFGN